MKITLFLLVLTGAFHTGNCTSIGVGYTSEKVLIWRFWEVGKDGSPIAKMLVYNVTDSSVRFSLKRCFYRTITDQPVASQRPANESRSLVDVGLPQFDELVFSDTIVNEEKIKPHSYRIYKLIALRHNGPYDMAFVNGISIGLMPGFSTRRAIVQGHKYYSYEGLQGGSSVGVMGKDKLVTRRGKKDAIYLSFPERKGWRIVTEQIQGIKALSFQFDNGICYKQGTENSSIEFKIDTGNASSDVRVSYSISKKKIKPVLSVRGEFQNGSICGQLPILIK